MGDMEQVVGRKNKLILIGIVAGLLVAIFSSVVGGIIGYFIAVRASNSLGGAITGGQKVQVTSEQSAVIDVVDKDSPAVVSIVAKGVDPFSGSLATQSAGTGFIVDASGVIVTNSHVVRDSSS